MTYLLDTCVLSEFTRKLPDKRVVEYLNNLSDIDVALSVISIGEIKDGIARVREQSKRNRLEKWFIEELLERYKNNIVSIDIDTMLIWGNMMASLKQNGITLPVMDSLIAAQCRQHSLSLVTRNVKDFEFAEISIINPWSE